MKLPLVDNILMIVDCINIRVQGGFGDSLELGFSAQPSIDFMFL